jgi:hypothetical protein
VREIAGASGTLSQIVSTLWKSDPETLCILLENPKSGRWIVITLDVRGEIAEIQSAPMREAC